MTSAFSWQNSISLCPASLWTYIINKYKRRKKIYKINPKQLRNTIVTYISIIILNVNGLNAPTKSTDWLNGYKNKTHIYAVYKKPTLDLKTHID